MQDDQDTSAKSSARPRLARTRFVELQPDQRTTGPLSTSGDLRADLARNSAGRAIQKRALHEDGRRSVSLRERSTLHFMQLSGMLRPLHDANASQDAAGVEDDGYWPLGIQQAGPLPLINMYGREPFGRTLPSAVPLVTPTDGAPARPTWQRLLVAPASKIAFGLLIGLGLLYLASLFINLPATFALLGTYLLTPQGIGLGLLAGLVLLVGQTLRGLRWKLFLNPVIDDISTLKIIGIYQVAALLNFLLPLRAGEAAKSLALKRIANVPISKSLPTVAIDKTLDLLLALIILMFVPVLGIAMNLQLWIVYGLGGLLLLILLLVSGLLAWQRPLALKSLRVLLTPLPRVLGNKIEGFVTGFGDALLAGISQTRVVWPALLLAALAVLCDSLFTMLVFGAIGTVIPFGTALAGSTLCTLFLVLPAPPGQPGSYEVAGLLVFSGLFGLSTNAVAAMCIFSHLWVALLLTIAGLGSMFALGLTISSTTRVESQPKKPASMSA